jgi:predicted component of type VI protein secretion system
MSATAAPLSYVLVDGSSRRTGSITHSPFTIGRLPENDIVLAHPYVSRRHAEIVVTDDGCFVVDQGSRHGTFVNGKQISARHLLGDDDTVQFGAADGPAMRLGTEQALGSTIRDIISHIPEIGASGTALEKLNWFFESARKLKTSGAIDQILAALVDTTLQLTKFERGYVFLRNSSLPSAATTTATPSPKRPPSRTAPSARPSTTPANTS